MAYYLFIGLMVFICQTQVCTAGIKFEKYIYRFVVTVSNLKKPKTAGFKKKHITHHEYTFRLDGKKPPLEDHYIKRNIGYNLNKLGYISSLIELTAKPITLKSTAIECKTKPPHTVMDADKGAENQLSSAPHSDHSGYTKS